MVLLPSDTDNTSTELGMERIIYQAKVPTAINILIGIFMALLIIVVPFTDDTFAIETDYPSILGMLALYWLIAMFVFKKFTLTENEFIVEYPPLAFVLKANRIPLNDIQKLVFDRTRGTSPVQFIEIYRVNIEESTRFQFFTSSEPKTYYFSINHDEIRILINKLRSQGVQVECGWK